MVDNKSNDKKKLRREKNKKPQISKNVGGLVINWEEKKTAKKNCMEKICDKLIEHKRKGRYDLLYQKEKQ